METILMILAGTCILVAIIAIAVLIRVLQRLDRAIKESIGVLSQFHSMLGTAHRELPAFLRQGQELMSQANQTLATTSEKLALLGEGLENFRQMSHRINSLEQHLQEKIEGPLMDAARVVAGVSKAIKTFADTFNRR